jgi:hypothetical protein
MSYDLSLAFAKRPTAAAIKAAIDRAGLEAQGGVREQFLAISRTDPAVALDITGPARIDDPDDVEGRLLQAVPKPRWDMLISRSAAAGQEGIRLAIQVAGDLARASAGAVYDPQAEKLLFPTETRPPAVKVPEKIRVVRLTWLLHHSRAGAETATALLAAMREYCPPAVPTRYGDVEPLRHRFDAGQEDQFAQFWERLNHNVVPLLFWKAEPPCFGGTASLLGQQPDPAQPVQIDVAFDGRVLEANAQARGAVVGLFTGAARRLVAFYAAGYVERNWIVQRRALFGDGSTEMLSITKTSFWDGFPQFPVWLTWFGRPYASRVRQSLTGFPMAEYPEGLALRIGELPQDLDQLTGTYPSLPVELSRQAAEPPRMSPGIQTTNDWSTPARRVLDLRRPPEPD